MPRVIAVPASIGNLGPGFDTLGLAISLYLRVKVRRKIDDGRGRLVARYERPRTNGEDGMYLSGAGPSVVAIARRNADNVARAIADIYRQENVPCTVRVQRVHQ